MESKKDLEKWIIALKGTRVFGIDPLKLNTSSDSGARLPVIITRLIGFVEKNCMANPSLYLYVLNKDEFSVAAALKNFLNRGLQLNDFDNQDSLKKIVPDLTKLLFSEFPDSLIPTPLHSDLSELVNCDISELKLHGILNKMSTPILRILVFLIEHFIKVSQLEVVNGMNWACLSRVWGPILLQGMNPDIAQRILLVLCSHLAMIKQYVSIDLNAVALAKMKLASEAQESKVDVWFDENLSPLSIEKVNCLTSCEQIVEKLKSVLEFKSDIDHLLFEERENLYSRPCLKREIVLQILKQSEEKQIKLWWKPSLMAIEKDEQKEMCGWLQKEGGSIKNWKKRFFKLTKEGLFYYKDASMKNQVGVISISNKNMYSIKTYPKSPTNYPICLRDEDCHRILAASSEEVRLQWIESFYQLKNKL